MTANKSENTTSQDGAAANPAASAASAEGADTTAKTSSVAEAIGKKVSDRANKKAEKKAAAEAATVEEELLAQMTEWREKAARAQAEFENAKRRMQAQQAVAISRASERVITALIPAIDDIELGIAHAEQSDNEMLDGLKAIQSKLATVLAAEKVEVVDPVDQAFDHDTAQAVQMIEDSTKPDQTVAQVLQKGYVMGAGTDNVRVLRPAMVVVTTNPGGEQ